MNDKNVCAKCLLDEFLQNYVTDEAIATRCDYCHRQSRARRLIAAPFHLVIERIIGGIEREFDDPANVLPYESAEGGYIGKTYDSWQVLDEIDPVTENDELIQDIRNALFDRLWCRRDYAALSREEALLSSWEHFQEFVKHKSRFFIGRSINESSRYLDMGAIPPSKTLSAVAQVVRVEDLVVTIPVGSAIFRARIASEVRDRTCKEMGPPPKDRALKYANRMSPAGIPMFYGAEDRKTAIAEIIDRNAKLPYVILTAKFVAVKPLSILDLASPRGIPSIFDENNAWRRPELIFLDKFTCDIAKPIRKDGREHTDYVPTQIVTEYFRSIFKHGKRRGVDGIRYRSSRNDHGVSVVIFAEQENCSELIPTISTYKEEIMLAFDPASVEKSNERKIKWTAHVSQSDFIDLKSSSPGEHSDSSDTQYNPRIFPKDLS